MPATAADVMQVATEIALGLRDRERDAEARTGHLSRAIRDAVLLGAVDSSTPRVPSSGDSRHTSTRPPLFIEGRLEVVDMEKLVGLGLVEAVMELGAELLKVAAAVEPNGQRERVRQAVRECLDELRRIAPSDTAAAYCARFERKLDVAVAKQVGPEAFVHLVNGLHDVLASELQQHVFLVVSAQDKTLYQEPAKWYGSRIDERFLAASADLSAACRCFALEQYTASVFHAMRTAEHGLRHIAGRAGVDFERESWGTVIDRVEKRRQELAKGPARGRDEALLKLVSDATSQLAAIKDAWRNHVAHTRETYDRRSAWRVLITVQAFMDSLAESKE